MKKLGVRLGLIAATLSALAGNVPRANAAEIELPDPKTVPREKWSDAMNVLTAMGIEGQRDIPKEMAGSVPGTVAHGSFVSGGIADLASGGISYSHPPSGLSGGGALAMGAGLFLLGGGGSPPVGLTQVAVWLPAELASSPQQANQVVAAQWDKARKAVTKNRISKIKTQTAKYHRGYDQRKSYPKLSDKLFHRPVQYDLPSHDGPSFLQHRNVYGPIFFLIDQLYSDARKNDLKLTVYLEKLSDELPEWFYIYYPGLKDKKQFYPPAIYNHGRTLFFIGK